MTGRWHGDAAMPSTLAAALAVALGAVSLHSVLTGYHWFPAVLLVIAVTAGLGLVGRRLAAPAPVVLAAQVLGVLVVCTARYAPGAALGRVVPTPSSVSALGTLLRAGGADLAAVLAPTYPRADLTLLAVGGVGLVAVAVDLVAVSVRRPAFAGMPLVLLVAVPAAIRERSVGYLALLAAVAGFLLLLLSGSEQRTGRWGPVLPNPGAPRPSGTLNNLGAGLRIGAGALALAVVVPLAIPGASVSPFGSSGFGAGGGHSSAVIVDPLVSVAAQLRDPSDQVLLTVRTPHEDYLRLTALETFDDGGFRLGPLAAPASARVGRRPGGGPVGGTSLTERLTASEGLAEMLLPLPTGTTAVGIDGDWRRSAPTDTVFSSNETTRGASWTATVDPTEPAGADLAAAGGRLGLPASAYPDAVAADLTVPADLPAVVGATARAWTAGAGTAYAAAAAIQRHFTDGSFAYDTAVAFGTGPTGFADFLAQRVGFCEQYATTMAAMLRSLGVPARVAIGFVGGQRVAPDTYAVSAADAHAWPEVYFQDAGWVRFEPTPRDDGLATAPAYTRPGTGGPTATRPGPSTSTATTAAPSSRRTPGTSLQDKLATLGSGDAGGAARQRSGRSPVWPWVGLGVLLAALLAAIPGLGGLLRRRRRLGARGEGSVEEVWGQLLDDAADRGVVLSAADSPRGLGRRLLRVLAPTGPTPAGAAAAVARLVDAVEQARYAAGGSGQATDGLAADEALLRRALAADLPWSPRLWAVLAPASARARLRRPLAAMVPALFGALDRLAGRRRAGAGPTGAPG